MITEREERLKEVFYDLLPYYNAKQSETPSDLKFILFLNKWMNPAMACYDIANHMICDSKLKRELSSKLASVQSGIGG